MRKSKEDASQSASELSRDNLLSSTTDSLALRSYKATAYLLPYLLLPMLPHRVKRAYTSCLQLFLRFNIQVAPVASTCPPSFFLPEAGAGQPT